MVEAMLDIRLGLGPIQRTQMVGSNHALSQLLHLRTLHHLPQLGLSDQKALQQCLIAKLEIRQHPQFFDRFWREVLRFVDDEKGAFLVQRRLAQKCLQRSKQYRLADSPHGQAKRCANRTQHVVRIELRADELRSDQLVTVDLLKKTADNCRLAGANLAGNDDEAFALVQAVLQVCERALVSATAEVER